MSEKYPGKLIVIEGIDGSGKTEQTVLLQKRLAQEGFKIAPNFDFPRYGEPPQGSPSSYFVRKYLGKKEFGFDHPGYGPADKVDPHAASLLYAVDRYDAAFSDDPRPNLIDFLKQGFVIVSNRYTESNIGHQASKIETSSEQEKFIRWLLHLEYELLKIPKPDLVLLFNMPPTIAARLKEEQLKARGLEKDAHEADESSIRKSSWAYLLAAKIFSDSWSVINVYDKNQFRLLSVAEVHKLAWREVQTRLFRGEKK